MSTDAELVAGVLAGDREAFAGIYDRYADRLFDFCMSVLRDRQDAEDAVQDTFVLVAQRLGQLNDPERLRPWLYAVARSVALRRTKARKRVVLDSEVTDMPDPSAGPQQAAEQAALRSLVWDAAAGLSERDRALLDLHLRQGLDGADLGEAVGVSASHAYVLLTRLRDQVERSLGALLIARLGRKDCAELSELLSSWDGTFSPLMRKRVARHVDGCELCGEKRRTMVSPLALLAAVPLVTAPVYLRDRVMENVELVAYSERPFKPPRASRLPMAAAAVVLLITIGLALVWERGGPVPGSPVALDLLPDTSSSAPSTGSQPDSPTTTVDPSTTTTTRPGTTTTRPTTTTSTTTTTTTEPPPPRDTIAPQITKQQANPTGIASGPPCQTTTTIQATATDNVGVTSMTANWKHTNGKAGSAPMAQRNGVWSATIGPFANGRVTVQTVASDAAGNVATGPNSFVSIQDCIS
jgi:RNA polymerase sigma factor (sigma-70 family)